MKNTRGFEAGHSRPPLICRECLKPLRFCRCTDATQNLVSTASFRVTLCTQTGLNDSNEKQSVWNHVWWISLNNTILQLWGARKFACVLHIRTEIYMTRYFGGTNVRGTWLKMCTVQCSLPTVAVATQPQRDACTYTLLPFSCVFASTTILPGARINVISVRTL